MTTDMMHLQALLEKNSDTDFLREMIAFAVQWLMDLEVEGLTGAGHGVRSGDRITQRNGYRDRDWDEPPRVRQRLVGLNYAAMVWSSSMA